MVIVSLPKISTTLTAIFRRIFGLLRARLVHLLNHLKRQDDIADLARLAVPHQLHLPLVLKQQKAILLR